MEKETDEEVKEGGTTHKCVCPWQSHACVQETATNQTFRPRHKRIHPGYIKTLYSRMNCPLAVRDPGPSASTLGQARGEAHKR
jgi:hypothetical protein